MNIKKLIKYFISGHSPVEILKYAYTGLGMIFAKIFFGKTSVKRNKIFVMTFDNSFSCNPKYIVKEILKSEEKFDIVWAVSNKGIPQGFPEEVRLVKRGSPKMFREMATAKIWIDNALNCVWYGLPKKDNQFYINTWHGSMGIKKLSGDEKWMARASRLNSFTDVAVTNSSFEEEVFRNTFWKDTEFLKVGHPRNDILFDETEYERIKKEIKALLSIPDGTKILLYAPTFRNSADTSCFDIDYEKLKESLEEKTHEKWAVLVRLHFKDRNAKSEIQFNEWLKDASFIDDMQELLCCADAGITDYSSWAYDFILTGKPLFIYATDIDEYNTEKGFYYPLETTPFVISRNNDELVESILNFNAKIYKENVKKFLAEKGCYEDGKASEKILSKIKEVCSL